MTPTPSIINAVSSWHKQFNQQQPSTLNAYCLKSLRNCFYQVENYHKLSQVNKQVS